MFKNKDLLYDFWWASQEKNYQKPLRRIAEMAGGARALYEMSEEEMARIPDIGEQYAHLVALRRKAWNLEEEYSVLNRLGIRFIPYYHPDYPGRLLRISDFPYAIFVRGDVPDDEKMSVAVIGARNCSEYGRRVADNLGRDLAGYGVQLVSGMAYGIDGLAQLACLNAGGRSFGVLGCGVDVCYPASNRNLYKALMLNGGVISEYGISTKPMAQLFPPRNRIISALCDVLVVVEAKVKSGTSITVDMALEQGRDIAVVPGRIYDELSEGCNNMLKQGAFPVTSAEDIMYVLNPSHYLDNENDELKERRLRTQKEKEIILSLSTDEEILYKSLDDSIKGVEWLMAETGLTLPYLINAIAGLKIKNLITEVSKGYYVRKSR